MHYYPLFLDLQSKAILIIGAGEVGRRKLHGILPCCPESVDVIDIAPMDMEMASLVNKGLLRYHQRPVCEEDFAGKHMVFAATSNADVNMQIAASCKLYGILCNIADSTTLSDFIVPAHFRRGDICICLGTGGASPALTKKMRMELEEWFDTKYAKLASFMKRLRPCLLSLNMPTRANTEIFRKMVNSDLAINLTQKDFAKVKVFLQQVLPKELHGSIEDLLHEL